MKKIFGFTKKKKQSSGASDNGSVLSAGYDVKEKDLGKVHKAAWLGDLAKLKQLAKKNDINQLDKENRTPLHIACACGHAEVVQFLVEGKAKLNLCDNQNRSALMKAVQGQHERCASILLENHAEPNLVDINGNTALHLAANIPSITTAASLLEHEADINAPNKEGFTPLTVAVREDHLDMAEFLIKEGAEVNFLDQDQRSPLMIAACNGQINMLRLLLKFGADVDLKDTKGWSADDHAVINGHHPCSLLINEHATQKRGGPSLTQDASKKGKKMSNPSKNAKAGFMLAGPATDKDEHGSDEAGRDFEDNSQSESLSRVSKSGADEWPSSEEEEESLLNEKKPKINLRKMIASKKGEECKQPPADSCASKTKQLDNEDEVDEEEEDEDEDDDEDEDEEEESDEDEEESEEESEEEDSEDEEDDDQPSSVDITDSDARNTAEDGASMPSPITGFIRLIPGVEEDCVVSAIRVESKLSDEEDSLSLPPSKPAAHLTHEAAEELGNESSKDREIASDGIKDGLFTHNKGLAYKTGGEGESEDTCFRDDDESLKQSGKRRSSWGSSLEEEDECEGKMEQSRLLSLTPSIAKPVKSVEDSQWDSSSECQEGASPAEQVNKMEESSACCHGKEEKNPVHAHDLAETDLIDEDNSWDDVSDKSEKCDRTEIVETQGSEVVKLEPKPEGWSSKSTEKGAKQVRECEGRDAAVVDDDVSDEDSDSLHQNLQYDFVSATVKVSDAGHDSDSDGHLNKDDAEAARLTAYVTLGDKNENLTEHGDVLADTQRNDSIDDDEEEEDEDDDVPEEDTDSSDDRLEESGDSFGVTAEDREGELSVENRRDFLSELGLETGEKVRESFDSESEHSRLPHKETMENPLESAAIDEDTKENLFYVPSFIRGEGCNRMLEPWRSVGMPRGSQGIQSPVVSNDNHSESTEATKKENAKWEPLLSKRESHKSETDLMNELNLGDCDDLEDASDWDTASNASKTTLPGRRVASPGGDDVPAHAKTSINEEEEEALSPVPQRRLSLDKEVVSSSPPPVPIPQPRARRLVVPDSEESDWDQDHSSLSSNKASQAADQFPHTEAAHVPTETTPSEKGRLLLSQQELEENDEALRGHLGSDREESDAFSQSPSPRERADAGPEVHWEKRYEKLWVEVEKRDVKTTFKSVACELKERFGELIKSRPPVREEQSDVDTVLDEEESSDDEGGEVIVRPTARARSTTLLTIPEQRESGQEDSVAASPDVSIAEKKRIFERDVHEETEPLADSTSSPLPELTATHAPDFKDHSVSNSPCFNDKEAEPDEYLEEQSSRLSASILGDSDEELEEDMGRFKAEVGKLKNAFLDLEKQQGQLQKEVVREVRRSGSACLSNHSASHALDAEKHESSSRLRNEMSSQAAATPREQELESTVSTSTGAFNSPKMTSKHKQEGQVAPQAELVGGTRPQRMHRASPKVNGKQLNVFDDSTLSDMSDNEGSPRFPSSAQRSKKSEGLEKAEDLDELTQSSDTTTDDIDSPAAGYRHASLLIQKLDSATLDCKSIVKLQNMFHEYERAIQMEKSRHRHLSDKVSQLETERAELKKSLEEVKDLKSALERNQLELQTEVTNLSFQLKQEQENARNATMMYNTARGKLRRSEEQQQLELQDRQNMELTFRKLELELRTTANNMKQLEEDHNETQRLLALERSARTQQESLVSSHLRKQLEMEAENKRNVSKSHEALSQLTEASDRERELQQQITCLNEQLSILRTKFEHLQADSSLKETHFLEENETLKEQLEDAKRDVKLNSDSFFTSNHQIATLKSELTMTAARLENERQAHESLMTELESSQTRLRGALQEVERCQSALANSEKALLKEKEELQHLRDKLSGEASSHREEVTSLCQKLGKAEENANKMENEAHRVSIQLSEKSMLLEILQREKDQIAARAKELESALQSEKELVSRAAARHEATQERLAQAQSEGMLMRQQLEEAQNKGVAKERAVTDAQERFSDILSKLRSDSEEKVQLVEERNKELASKAADLREQVYKLEEEKNARVTELRELQQELTDSLKKLSMSEASLEVNSRYRNDLEEEKCRLLKDVDRLKAKLEESETQHVQAERRINSLKSRLDDREKELGNAAQKQQEALSASASSVTTIKQLEEAVQRLEIENVKLEAAAKQQSNKIEALQKEAQEATMRHSGSQGGRVKGHLEDLVSNLQSSKMTLEDQLNREVQKQSTLSHTAQDSQAMWEEEMKSSSKLGLRIAELEKNKGDLSAQVEIEKKKVKKFAELKKMSEARLEQELQRNTDLQKEMFRLRTLLKTAKRKLKDGGGAEFASPMSTLRTDMGHYSQGDGSLGKMKVDELQVQLDRETSQRRELERQNRDLKDQLASGRSLGAGSDQLERRKRQLEEEVLELRRRLDLSQTEQNQVDHYRREIEEKCRQELQQKIDQVNRFLQSQAESQEALDQMRSANEANLRSKYEQRILELEGELGRVRTIQHDSLSQRDSTRTELERFQQLYREELRLRKSLDAKLERANARLEKANSKLLQERSRSLRLGGGASLDVGSIGHYGMSLGHLNRSLGLGLTHLTPTTEGQKATVADYLAKMQSEFDKSITRELSDARAELDSASALRTELDPVSRANQEYLEVMKKNYMI
ncbi:ankyrin repeat domain-containing protein 26 isoform X2 [Synchiropus splendidus]|uniref:ankyrin repeat domain-containing protein 26 isoform X2 n=1 Tax=Synchiropus splendidus TaxID=270530 RepID=UPI00237E86BB|nr:ankyrin repeat domain-containing protein 26 isoform X2 [Synchiropus splendidus]